MKNNLNALYNSVHDDHVKHEVVSQLNAYNGINFGVLDVQTLFDAIEKQKKGKSAGPNGYLSPFGRKSPASATFMVRNRPWGFRVRARRR